MAAGVINLQKESGGIVKISPADGTGVTELVVPESGNLVSVDTAVTDNSIARYDGTTGKLQNSGVIVDDNGNVGIGVTPIEGAAPLQLHNVSSIGFQGQYGYIWANVKYTDGYRYVTSANATAFDMSNGNFIWKTAPSGTAGNAITWTNAMILGANGNLLVGTSTDNGVDKLQVNGSITYRTSQYKYSNLNNACTVNENTIVNNTCLNIPINDYGYVSVSVATPNGYCMQTFVGLNGPVRMFIRVLAGGDWSAWVEK